MPVNMKSYALSTLVFVDFAVFLRIFSYSSMRDKKPFEHSSWYTNSIKLHENPDSKVYGAHLGPTGTLLSGKLICKNSPQGRIQDFRI